MKKIDWAASFDPEGIKQWDLDDKHILEYGRKVEAILDQLASIGSTNEGKSFVKGLKIKYWAGLVDQDLVNSTSTLKSQSEFIQRFYFFEGQPGITIFEANKFLLNKLLEKEILTKEKTAEDSKKKERKGNGTTSKINSLLPKKRSSQSSNGKTSK